MVLLLILLGFSGAPDHPPLQVAPPPACPVEGPDSDSDGIGDVCEMSLLMRFAPSLVVSSRACNWNEGSGRLDGGYLVGAHPQADGIRLAYLPAYLDDCGWSGAKCLLRDGQ